MKPLTEWDKLPKFLIGDSDDDRVFVIHLHYPRFVAEVVEQGVTGTVSMEPLWIDKPDDLSASEGARLMREAGDFYAAEIERGEP
jgi:hypothetical protein